MIVGVSRVKQFLACPRQWWFSEVAGVKLGHSYGQVFGNVLHACVERWLNEEEPHPPGWQWDPDSRERIDDKDDSLIQTLVSQAIEKGYLRRHPARLVEHEWWAVIDQPASRGFPRPLIAKGTIDLSEPGVIVDHKGTKNAKQYAKTKEELKEDLQLLVYLYVSENIRQIEHKDDDVLTVGHITYCRATATVNERPVQVKWKDAVKAWNHFTSTARRMLPLATVAGPRQVECALDQPARADGKRTCDDYGGCGYLPVCSSKNMGAELQKLRNVQLRASLPPRARADFERKFNVVKKSAKIQPENDEDEDEAPPPKVKAKKPNPFVDPDDSDEDEDEPAPPPVKKKAKVVEPEDDEDEDEPAPPPVKKKAKVVEPEDDEDEDEPAPPPVKKKAKVVEPEEDEAPTPVKAKGGNATSTAGFIVTTVERNDPKAAKVIKAIRGMSHEDLSNRLALIYCEILGLAGTEDV